MRQVVHSVSVDNFVFYFSVMLCTGATFVKKNSCLVARIVSFDTAGLHLLAFRILESYPSKDIELDLSSLQLSLI